jgi:choline dehydrogenase-like flavoprotein
VIIDVSTTELPANGVRTEVAVIGSGPAGIVTALELGDAGVDVVLVESGQGSWTPEAQELAAAAEWDPSLHSPMSITTSRQLGGTSAIWGGRCVPYDPIDFDERAHVPFARWPITYEDVRLHFGRACEWMVCGRPVFDVAGASHLPPTLTPGLPDGDVLTSSLERWSLPTDFGEVYGARLRRSGTVRVLTGLTCTRIVSEPGSGRADRLECRTLAGRSVAIHARTFVVACGGLESTRLLMASEGPAGGQLGGRSGHLGRWYMGHVEGVVANVAFSTPPRQTVFDYERDIDGTYVRRRFSFSREFQHAKELPNIVAWLANPNLPDPAHQSGELSFAYLALASPLGRVFAPPAQRLALTGNVVPGSPYGGSEKGRVVDHLRNIALDPVSTARFVFGFGAKRFLARHRRVPGFFAYRPDNVYPLQFHGEHLPRADSKVTLTRERDAVGMPKLAIDVRFSDDDVDGVVRAHRYWDEHLSATGAGRIEYLEPHDVAGSVRKRFGAGFHQIGTTRMSERPSDGVVDRNLAVHGTPDVHVVSSSSFPTSGQANSTFMIVVFAVRLAQHLLRSRRGAAVAAAPAPGQPTAAHP